MDLSAAEAATQRSSKSKQQCNHCKKLGHFAYECLAPRPASRQQSAGSFNKNQQKKGQTNSGNGAGGRSKND